MTKLVSGYPDLDRRIAENDADSAWVGDRVQLRAHEPGDVETLPAYADSADERSLWMVMQPRSRVAAKSSFEEYAAKRPGPDMVNFDLVIARREDDVMVGGIGVLAANQINGTFRYNLVIHPDHKGNGYGAEAALLVFRFMFDERRFQKCESIVFGYNDASISLHRKLGFVEEGRQRRHLFQAGGYHDALLFGMTVEEFHELYPLLRSTL